MKWIPIGLDGWYSELTPLERDIEIAKAVAAPAEGIILAAPDDSGKRPTWHPVLIRKAQVVPFTGWRNEEAQTEA